MKKNFLVLSTGFALFSMFFGSGNLVFPILVGKESGAHFFLSSLGIILTGVIVPFLGALGIMLYGGDHKDFFKSMGKTGIFVFSLISLSLMGPFGVMPRCLTVAHGALDNLFPAIPLAGVSLVFCALIYLVSIFKNKIVPALGTILTPLLLLSILAIAVFALKEIGHVPVTASTATSWFSFKNGFLQGYQTMDLLAAFFFSTFVINHLKSTKPQDACGKSTLKLFLQSACVGGGVLAAVYFILVLLGSIHAESLQGVLPQQMLGHVAIKTLGPFGAPVLSLVVVLACFTTAIVLVSLFADFLRTEICKGKINRHIALLTTLAIGFTVSIQGFSGIAKVIGPILEIIYPALIVLTFVNIAHKFWGFRSSHWPVTLTLLAKIGLLRFI